MQPSHWPQNLHLREAEWQLVLDWNDGMVDWKPHFFNLFIFFSPENSKHPNLFRQFFFLWSWSTRENATGSYRFMVLVEQCRIFDPLSSYSPRLHKKDTYRHSTEASQDLRCCGSDPWRDPLRWTSHPNTEHQACEVWWLMWQGRLPSLFQGGTIVTVSYSFIDWMAANSLLSKNLQTWANGNCCATFSNKSKEKQIQG